MDLGEKIIINKYSFTSYYVEIFFDDIILSRASCFFTKRGEKRYLVSNWHVVSGKDADTLECLDKMAAVPNKLHVYLPEGTNEDGIIFDDSFIELDLYDADGQKVWYEMKKNGQMIDIAVIPFHNKTEKFILDIEDAEEPFNESIPLTIAEEIYIIGFPFRRIGGSLPIWKKASVASEPSVDLNGMPCYYADTATRSGMSGSPVVIYRKRPFVEAESMDGRFSQYITKFVGVYSGRIGANTDGKNDAQLGRVWKAKMIDEIIESNENK